MTARVKNHPKPIHVDLAIVLHLLGSVQSQWSRQVRQLRFRHNGAGTHTFSNSVKHALWLASLTINVLSHFLTVPLRDYLLARRLLLVDY